MKNFLSILAAVALFAAAAPLSAAPVKLTPSENIVERKHTSAMNFHRIDVSQLIRLTVEERDDNVIVVRANENVLPYVVLTVSGGTLTARLKDIKVVNASKGGGLSVEVFVPDNGKIDRISVAGASSVEVEPSVVAKTFMGEVHGASSLKVKVETEKADFKISGVSKVETDCRCAEFSLDMSGCSAFEGGVETTKSSIEAHGASAVNIRGRSGKADIEISGASSYSGLGFRTEVCSIEASGTSSAEVFCSAVLSAEASGVSNIIYSGGCGLSHFSTSGMSKIKLK